MANILSRRIAALLATLALVLAGCGGGGSGGEPTGPFTVSGQAQKGPLMFGSWVWVSELDDDLNPTGKTYLSQISDHVGNFTLSSAVSSNVVQLVATGYYLDELTGTLSAAPVTLSAIADLRVDNSPTVNVLTTIQSPRLKALMRSGKNYRDANAQSQAEVLAAFGIDVAKITGMQSLYAMSINGSTDQDSALLAASAVLSKMASNAAAASGSSQAAEISHLMGQIASEIAASGQVTTASIGQARVTASRQLDLAAVRTNIEAYYARQGVALTAAKFEEWVDHDGSGVLPRRLLPVSGLVFAPSTNAEANAIYTSPGATIAGLPSGVAAAVSVDAETRIVKNGGEIPTGATTTLSNGDTLALRRVSAKAFASTVTSTVTVGTTQATWTLVTRAMPALAIQVAGSQDRPLIVFPPMEFIAAAVPFQPARTMTIHYAGVATNFGNPIASMEIRADAGGFPGNVLATSAAVHDYFGSTFYKQASFGAAGVQLQAGTVYWIVVHQQRLGPAMVYEGTAAPPLPGLRYLSGSSWVEPNYHPTYNGVPQVPAYFVAE